MLVWSSLGPWALGTGNLHCCFFVNYIMVMLSASNERKVFMSPAHWDGMW